MAIKRIFTPPVFEDDEKNRIARLLNVILWAVIGLLTGLVLYKLIVQGESLTSRSGIANITLILLMVGLGVVIRSGYVKTASIILIVVSWLNLTYQAWFSGGLRDAAFIAYIVVILLANLLLGWQAGLVVAGVSIAAGWVLAYAETAGFLAVNIDPPYEISSEMTVIFGLAAIILALTTAGLNSALKRARRSEQSLTESNRELQALSTSLEEQVMARTQRLKIVAGLSERLSAQLHLHELLVEVVRSLKESFGYYHTQIYLFDEARQNLRLASATGPAGQAMLAGQHSIPLGKGLVGRAAARNSVVLAPNLARMIAPEIITPANVDLVYQRQADPLFQTNWYRNYINRTFADLDRLAVSTDRLARPLRFGYVMHFSGDFTNEIKRGAQDAARDLGVDIEVVAPGNPADPAEISGLYDQMLAARKDGLIVIPQFETLWPARFKKAADLGIPVVTANLTGPAVAGWAWFGQDGYQAGFVLAQEFKQTLAANGLHSGTIVVGVSTFEPELLARCEGFKKGLQNTAYTLTPPQETTLDVESNFRIWAGLVAEHPDMIAAAGLSALDIPSLARVKQRDNAAWLIAGFDLEVATLDALKAGLAQVAIGQHPYLQGYLPVLALVQHRRQGKPLQDWIVEGWLPNPLLPDTKAELSVPIMLGAEGQVVGVLDVQADKVDGLDESDADLLRSLANQVAVAIRNARLFEQVEAALADARAAQARYLKQAWQQVKQRKLGGQYHYARVEAPPLSESAIAVGRQQALAHNKLALVTLAEDGSAPQTIVAPIKVADQPIGALQLHPLGVDQSWNEDDLAVVEAVLGELGQAAESLRLFEETQERAGREQTIREITDKLRAAPSLNALLEIASRELGQRLGVPQTVLELGIDSSTELAGPKNGQP